MTRHIEKTDHRLGELRGEWEGTCRTWFEPDRVADESAIFGEFEMPFGASVLRHRYHGTINGHERVGEEMIAFNAIKRIFEVAWVDSHHRLSLSSTTYLNCGSK